MTEGVGNDYRQEALRLVASMQDWARDNVSATPDGHTGADCQWCPLCQFVAVLRGERPEVTERVSEAGVAVLGALRGLLDAVVGSAPAPGAHRVPQDGADAADGADLNSEPPSRVQHIHLGGEN